MSQKKLSQQSFNLPEISLPDNFFSNFEEITNKYANLDQKLSTTKNIDINNYNIKDNNDSFINDMKNIKFHPINKAEYAELIFDSPKAKKIYKNQRTSNGDIFLKEEDSNIFTHFLKSDFYLKNRNKRNNNDMNYLDDDKNNNCVIPNFKEILKPQSWDDDVEFINENIFTNKSFKPFQKEIINSI